MASITLKHVYKTYENNVGIIKDFNLQVDDKDFVVFVGPSGCGKSTTLRMIAGLESISEGELEIDGKCMNEVSAADRDIAMVFQNYALYPHMTVGENIGYSLKIAGVPKKERTEQVNEVARMLDIDQVLDRKPKELSGGQKQRVAMGRAIIRKPKAFLMDEPLSNLDAKLRNKMRTEIKMLHQKLGTTIVYVTHDQTEAMTLGTKIVVLKDGIIQQVDSPAKLYDHPQNTFVAQFIGIPQMNLFEGKIYLEEEKYTLRIEGGEIPLSPDMGDALLDKGYVGDMVTVGLRPEDIMICQDGVLHAVVEVYELLGSESYVYFQFQGKKMCARVSAELAISVGDSFRFSVKQDKMHLFDYYRGNRIEENDLQ